MHDASDQTLRALVNARAAELVDAWLAEDVQAPDGDPRRVVPALALPPAAELRALGERVLGVLADGADGAFLEHVARSGLHHVAADALLAMTQRLVRRVRRAAREEAPPGPPRAREALLEHLEDRAEHLVGLLFRAEAARLRAALPGTGEAPVTEAMAALHDAVYSRLATGAMRWVSPGIEALTGQPAESFLEDAQAWPRLVVPEDLPILQQLLAGVLSRREPAEAAYRIRETRTGHLRRVLDRAMPVVEGGEVRRIDGLLIDLTERLELASRLQRSAQIRSVGRLARDVAHDFSNLLVGILGHADLLLSRLDPDGRDARSARLIAGAAERGAELADRLNALARGTAPSAATTALHPGLLARQAADRAREGFPDRLQLDVRVSPETPRVQGDPERLALALGHLLDNAREACEEGRGGRIAVEARPAAPDEASRIGAIAAAVILVADDGPGMTDDVKARLFDPLFTTRQDAGGTGIGGAVAFGVAVEQGGVLEVDSQPGHGSVLRLILPALDDAPAPAVTRPVTRPHLRIDTASWRTPTDENRRPRVLVVDDESSVRQLLKDLLEGAGFDVSAVATGVEALERVEASPSAVDLVVLDVMMHPVDGTEVFAELRARHPALPIIFCTGHSDAQRIAFPEALTRAEVVRKPFRAAQLIRAVRAALDR